MSLKLRCGDADVAHRNGHLILDLRSGVSKEDFAVQVIKTLDSASAPALHTTTTSNTTTSLSGPSNASTITDTQPTSASASRQLPTQAAPSPNSSSHTTAGGTDSPRDTAIERLMADRRLKLEKQRKEQEASDRAARKAQAETRRAAESVDPRSTKGQQATYASEQIQRKQEAHQERARILNQIEQDKLERKEREERRKLAATGKSTGDSSSKTGLKELTATAPASSSASGSAQCALQVRLVDGSTIRTRFPSDNTIASHVRPWIDATNPKTKDAYTLKQILSPLPNRTIGPQEEEEQTLASLDLTPSSTLVLVPIRGASQAYASAPGPIVGAFSSIYNTLAALLATLWGFLATFLGVGQAPQQGQRAAEERETGSSANVVQEQAAAGSAPKMRIRTLGDQREEQRKKDGDKQFYNGNQVSTGGGSNITLILTGSSS